MTQGKTPFFIVGRPPAVLAAGLLAVVALTALDLWSKSWAEENLSRPRRGEIPEVCAPGEDGWADYQRLRGDSVTLIDDILELEYAENCGAAFSLLHWADHPIRVAIFSTAACLAVVFLSLLFVRGRGGPWLMVGVPMVVSGALGNLVNRVNYGYVVDFIHFHWHDSFDYPVFNVADIGVVVGVICLVLDGWLTPEPKAEDQAKVAAARQAEPVVEEEDDDEAADDAPLATEPAPTAPAATDPDAEGSR